jgi:hypothetical protein
MITIEFIKEHPPKPSKKGGVYYPIGVLGTDQKWYSSFKDKWNSHWCAGYTIADHEVSIVEKVMPDGTVFTNLKKPSAAGVSPVDPSLAARMTALEARVSALSVRVDLIGAVVPAPTVMAQGNSPLVAWAHPDPDPAATQRQATRRAEEPPHPAYASDASEDPWNQ